MQAFHERGKRDLGVKGFGVCVAQHSGGGVKADSKCLEGKAGTRV